MLNVEDIFPIKIATANINRELSDEEVQALTPYSLDTVPGELNNSSREMNVLQNPKLASIREFIEESINSYLRDVEGCAEGVRGVISQSWLNYTKPGEAHAKHFHTNSFISGAFYIDTGDQGGMLLFQQTPKNILQPASPNHPAFHRNYKMQIVRKGDVLLFPSYVEHSVPKNTSDKTRVSLAFNVFPRGVMGSYEHASLLDLT